MEITHTESTNAAETSFDGFFNANPWIHPRLSEVETLLDPKADLREVYAQLTDQSAPESWRQPDWARVDAAALSETIAADLLRALSSMGIDGNTCSKQLLWLVGDDIGDCELEEQSYKELVDDVAREAVRFRIERHKARLQMDEGLM